MASQRSSNPSGATENRRIWAVPVDEARTDPKVWRRAATPHSRTPHLEKRHLAVSFIESATVGFCSRSSFSLDRWSAALNRWSRCWRPGIRPSRLRCPCAGHPSGHGWPRASGHRRRWPDSTARPDLLAPHARSSAVIAHRSWSRHSPSMCRYRGLYPSFRNPARRTRRILASLAG